MTRFINILIEIFKLSATPPSIVYPVPLLALLLFSLSDCRNFFCLLLAILFTFASQAGINLWNHVNDVEEDMLAGKRNVFIESPEVRKLGYVISVLLYFSSFVLLYMFTKERISLLFFLLVCAVTWIYSDRVFFGRFFRRWKEYYLTEIVTYLISVPLYTLTVWSFFDRIGLRAIATAAFMTPFALSGTFLKDIKDTSGDEMAGLKTLAVVFSPSTLLRVSITLLWMYYLEILVFSITGILPVYTLFGFLTFPALVYSTLRFMRNEWLISFDVVGVVKVMVYSNLLSLSLIVAGCLVLRP